LTLGETVRISWRLADPRESLAVMLDEGLRAEAGGADLLLFVFITLILPASASS
jgi:hypothetical protein